MKSGTQSLDETIWASLSRNAFRIGMDLPALLQTMRELLDNSYERKKTEFKPAARRLNVGFVLHLVSGWKFK